MLGQAIKISAFLMDHLQQRVKNGALRRRGRYARYRAKLSIQNHVILYESFNGRGLLCNPYAIFLALTKDPAYRNMHHVWVLDDLNSHTKLMSECKKKYKNIHFVQYQSRQYLKYLCKAKYLVNNSTFPGYFNKRDGQVYINTWHGVPLKAMGFDMPNGAIEASNTLRNFLHADYLLSTGKILTDMYTKAYKLQGLYQGKILECGYPRLDLLKVIPREQVLETLKKQGVAVEDGKKIILYAPTWRGQSFSDVSTDIDEYTQVKAKLDACKEISDQYQVLVKVHQSVYAKLKNKHQYPWMVPATVDANEILSVTDVLISDFSSIFFDFLATDRPIIFYIPDADSYQGVRGLNFGIESLPGACATNMDELVKLLKSGEFGQINRDNYQRLKKLTCDYPVGSISETVIRAIFQKDERDCKVVTCLDDRKKILFVRGRMRMNGISSSMINLLNQIDHSKYDVSVMIGKPTDDIEQYLIDRVNPQTRILIRNTVINTTLWEDICQDISSNYGTFGRYQRFWKRDIFRKEFHRSYGDAQFDYVLDFDGYNTSFSLIHLEHPGAKKGIWMHNDMYAEMKLKFPWLRRQVALYNHYDYMISCSKEIMEVNREKLSTPDTYHKFVYAKNLINIEQILRQRDNECIVDIRGVRHLLIADLEQTVKEGKLIPMHEVSAETGKPEERAINFITVGRCSPEKNHSNLIKAFAAFTGKYKNARLYLVGDGPQREKIAGLVATLNLGDKVIMTGNISNPIALMKHCDCFILPSLHEGQPMVLNEARVLGMPMVISRFSSVEGACIPGGQYLIHSDVDGILEGLNAFAEGKVPSDYEFDPYVYNQEAYGEFLRAIGEEK